jgi:hypothetical protein
LNVDMAIQLTFSPTEIRRVPALLQPGHSAGPVPHKNERDIDAVVQRAGRGGEPPPIHA